MPRPRRIVPPRQWRIDSDEPLPTGRQALDQPFSAFPSWLMKVTCDRCGQERIFAEAHAARQRDMLIRDIPVIGQCGEEFRDRARRVGLQISG